MKEPYDDIVPRLEAHANDADNWSDSYVGRMNLGIAVSRIAKRGP